MALVSPRVTGSLRPSSARGVELVLLVFAAVVVTIALVLVEAEQNQRLSNQLLYLGAGYLGLFAVAHLVVRRTAAYADPLILPTVALLNGLGLVMIHRLDLAGALGLAGFLVLTLAIKIKYFVKNC